jgi:hypothetical protein
VRARFDTGNLTDFLARNRARLRGYTFLLPLSQPAWEWIMAAMTVSIMLDGADEKLRSLANWLRDEDDLRGRVRVSPAPIPEGRMGGAVDAIVVVLTSATVGTMVTSVKDWLVAKRIAEKVTFTLRSETGREIDLTCGSATDAETLLGSAREFFQEGRDVPPGR